MEYSEKKREIAKHFEEIIRLIGEDPGREGLVETPERFARMYLELFSGVRREPEEKDMKCFSEGNHDEAIIIKDIPFYSMCEHHFIPFFGKAHIVYIPNKKICGLSKVARILEFYARRPQLQERITTQIADAIERILAPKGIMVIIEAEHLCISMRGVQKPGTITQTSCVRGVFRDKPEARAEALSLIKK